MPDYYTNVGNSEILNWIGEAYRAAGAPLSKLSKQTVIDRSMTFYKGATLSRVSKQSVIDRSMTFYKGAPLSRVSKQTVIDRSMTLSKNCH